MQLEAKKHVSHNRRFRSAVRIICEELFTRAQTSPIIVEIKDFWETPNYMPTAERRATIGEESYVADQVMKRLRRKYSLCVVAITRDAFDLKISQLLKLTVKGAVPLVSPSPGDPTIGMYISTVSDGSLFAAYERVNGRRQVYGRIIAFHERANRELKNKRLSKPAKTAVLQDAKKLATDLSIQLRLPY